MSNPFLSLAKSIPDFLKASTDLTLQILIVFTLTSLLAFYVSFISSTNGSSLIFSLPYQLNIITNFSLLQHN